ncbi:MAG: isochorismatase family protein [Cyanobacteria bacterium P01_A01_bin.135]
MSNPNSPYLVKLTRDNCVLVLVDFLTGFLPGIKTIDHGTFVNNAVALAKIGQIFELPTIVLGDEGGFRGQFFPEIAPYLNRGVHVERHTPSAWGAPRFVETLKQWERPKVVIGGISIDNCTLQTVLDLLINDYEAYVVVEACGTDSALVEQAAMMRLTQAGAVMTNWVSVAAELMQDWQTPEGEKIGALYQEYSRWGGG